MTSTPPTNAAITDGERSPRPPVAWVIFAAGLMDFSALRIVWLVSRHDPQVHVPAFVAYALAFVMVTGSSMALLKVFGRGEHVDWLVVPLLVGMTVTFGWVGLYGDPRYCTSRGPIWMPLPSCHVAFTGAAMLMLLVTWLAARSVWRQWRLGASGKSPLA